MKRGLQLIALVVAGFLAAVLVVLYDDYGSHPLVPSGRWLAWGVSSGFLVWMVVLDHRRNWSHVWFWASLAGLFALHTGAYVAAFEAVHSWRSSWFIPIALVEYPVFLLVLGGLGYKEYGRSGRRKRDAALDTRTEGRQ